MRLLINNFLYRLSDFVHGFGGNHLEINSLGL